MTVQKSPSIQGLRAIAVLAVLAYHLDLKWLQGGFLGVDLFFVLSGYLITSLALHEIRSTGKFSPSAFVGRRARRILPASVATLTSVMVFGWTVGWDAPPGRDVRWAGLYVANWNFIVNRVPYGSEALTPSPVLHFWSLAIEEQWYLLFPLMMFALGMVALRRPKTLTFIFLSLSIASAVSMLVLALSQRFDLARLYFGTDTRLFAILLGATGATVAGIGKQPVDSTRDRAWTASTITGLAVIGLLFVVGREDSLWMYTWGFQLTAVLALVVVVCAVRSEPRILHWKPLQRIGDLSYSIYLWHWPVIVATRPDRFEMSGTWRFVLRVVLTLALSSASYRFVEQPFLNARSSSRLRARNRTLMLATSAALVVSVTIPYPGHYRPGTFAKALAELNESASGSTPTVAPRVRTGTQGAVPSASVLIIGDSVSYWLSENFRKMALDEYVESTWKLDLNILNASRPGCGIFSLGANSKKYKCDELKMLRSELLLQHEPALVVIMMSFWDMYDIEIEDSRVSIESKQWHDEFIKVVGEEIRSLTMSGAKVVVVDAPCTHQYSVGLFFKKLGVKTADTRRKILNSYVDEVSKSFSPPVAVFNPEEFLCPSGSILDKIDGVTVRKDGVHYYNEGQRLFWDWLAPKLAFALKG